jgi:hypothetical protein
LRCSSKALAPSKSGLIATESGGKVTIRKRVPPGSAMNEVTLGVGSSWLAGKAGVSAVDHSSASAKPG